MRLSKNLYPKRSYAPGYDPTDTAFVNTEEGVLTIGGDLIPSSADFLEFPKTIKVVAQVVPIAKEGESPQALMTHDLPTPYTPCNVYDNWGDIGSHGQWQGIQIIVRSVSGVPNPHLTGMEGRVIFEKRFICQNTPILMRKWIDNGQMIVDPPGISGGEPLWGYGGYYRTGCQLEDIEQIVFTLGAKGRDTTVFPTRLSQWIFQGIYPWQPPKTGQKTIFMDSIPKEESSNLKTQIEQKGVVIAVAEGVDETGEFLERFYESYDVGPLDTVSNTFDILLKERESA